MKKLVCICLMVLAMAGLCLCASAEGTEKAVLAGSSSVPVGETVAVSVTLSGCDDTMGLGVSPVFDETVFELVGAMWQVSDKTFDLEAGSDSLAWDTPTNPNGWMFTFTLRAKEEAVVDSVHSVSCQISLLTDTGESIDVANVQPIQIQIICPHQFKKNITVEYLAVAATCTTPAEYYKSCALCGVASTETFLSTEAVSHIFKDREDNKYLVQPGDCQNRAVYYVSCSACGLVGEETFAGRMLGDHVYDNDCDEKCNACFDKRAVEHTPAQELSADESGHYHACSACGEKLDLTAHTPGPEATEEADQTCTECGYVIATYAPHVHDFSPEWTADQHSHWYECECDGRKDLADHVWEDGACSVCGVVEDTTAPDPTEPTAGNPTAVTQRPEDDSSVAALVLAMLLAASLIGNVVLVFLLMKARRE